MFLRALPVKAYSPMVINLFGSVISVSAEHPAKAYPPMLFNSVESVILLNDVQPSNAWYVISDTVLGILIEANEVQF